MPYDTEPFGELGQASFFEPRSPVGDIPWLALAAGPHSRSPLDQAYPSPVDQGYLSLGDQARALSLNRTG